MTPFLAIHAKGGESISPKQKDRTSTPISKALNVVFNWYCIYDISKIWYLLKLVSSKKFYLNWYLKYLIFFQFEKPS
jgi:hypothetical protein